MQNLSNQHESRLNQSLVNQKTNLFEGLNLQCPFFEPAYEYCCQQNCKENAVICVNDDCKCKIAHPNCDYFSKVKTFNQKINNKIINYSHHDFQEIEKNTTKIVDRVSQMLEQINTSFKTFGLNQNEEKIKDSVIDHFNKINFIANKEKLTGENLFKFRAEQKQADKQWFQYSIKKYRDIVKQTKKAIEPLFDQIQTTLTYIHSVHSQEKSLKNYMSNSAILKQIPMSLRSDIQKFTEILNKNLSVSSIKKVYSFTKENRIVPFQQPQQQPLQGQFGFANNNKKQSVLPLPKAQRERMMKDQDFYSKQFYGAIKNKSNLVFLILNSNGNSYGVYTPCTMEQSKEWKSDTNKESFLFRVNSDYSQKLHKPQMGLRFSPQNVLIGNIGETWDNTGNGFKLCLQNGQFSYKISFISNPVPNNNQNSGLFHSNNNQMVYQNESVVSMMEVYQLQVQKNIQPKSEVKNQAVSVNSLFDQPAQVKKFRRITVDN